MNTNAYAKLTHVYIRLVRGYSPGASSEIENIYHLYGARAAYQAALSLSLLVNRVKRHNPIDLSELSTRNLDAVPEAIPLFQKAAAALAKDLEGSPAER
jgi:hypothetical protein